MDATLTAIIAAFVQACAKVAALQQRVAERDARIAELEAQAAALKAKSDAS